MTLQHLPFPFVFSGLMFGQTFLLLRGLANSEGDHTFDGTDTVVGDQDLADGAGTSSELHILLKRRGVARRSAQQGQGARSEHLCAPGYIRTNSCAGLS